MAQRSSFGKLQRDRAKKAKQELKRERRQERLDSGPEDDVEIDALLGEDGKELSASELLVLVEALHKQYDEKQIDLDTFEEKKADLMARLPID